MGTLVISSKIDHDLNIEINHAIQKYSKIFPNKSTLLRIALINLLNELNIDSRAHIEAVYQQKENDSTENAINNVFSIYPKKKLSLRRIKKKREHRSK